MTPLYRFQRTLAKPSRTIIGLMSGMSMDGVDLAFARCSGDFPKYKIEAISSDYRPYSSAIKARLKESQHGNVAEVAKLNILVAREFAACVNDFLAKNKISIDDIDAIGSHGQTIYHASSRESEVATTLQIGTPSIISELTGITTIGNFRLRDIAAGGQGAPLVAFADYVLHGDESKPLGLLNLGSIANITVLTENYQDIVAFDLGPANMPIDFFAANGCPNGIDQDGSISKQGRVILPLLHSLAALAYFNVEPPKAAGYGEFGPEILSKICQPYLNSSLPDLLCTAVEFSASTLSTGIRKYVLPNHSSLRRIKVSGGGIYNKTLIQRIRILLPELSIEVLEDKYSDSKEALAFAVLAHATLSGMPGNIPNATGASKAVVLGEISI